MRNSHRKFPVGRVRLALTAVVLLVLAAVWGLLLSGGLSAEEVVSSSMAPTLRIGDRILVREIGARTPVARGEVVMVRSQDPKDPFPLVKRVAAGPGDFVVVLENQVFVNRKPARWEVERLGIWPPRSGHMYTLADDRYFVIGDNRASSYDSVFFGPVKREDILGRALAIYAPLERARAL